MKFEETAKLMLSEDYKERFIAEYNQVRMRYFRLQKMVENWDNLGFKPTCGKEVYIGQMQTMKKYMEILEKRAVEEDVNIWED